MKKDSVPAISNNPIMVTDIDAKRKVSKNKGYAKLTNYFLHVTSLKEFQTKIEEIRKKYNIPIHGFKVSDRNKWFKKNPYDLPECWTPPNTKKPYLFQDELDLIAAKYELHEMSFDLALFECLFFNTTSAAQRLWWSPTVCLARDLPTEKFVIKHKEHNLYFATENEEIGKRDKQYPIAISISPHASINDMIDFIRKNKVEIQRLQNKYKNPDISIGRHRNRTTKLRDEFILKNRRLPRKEIAQMVSKKFGQTIDEIYIRNVISRELKKRKEV